MYKRVVLSENLNVFAMSDIKTFCRLTDTTEDGLLRQMVEASIKEVEAHTNNYITQKIVKITTTGSMVELVGKLLTLTFKKIKAMKIKIVKDTMWFRAGNIYDLDTDVANQMVALGDAELYVDKPTKTTLDEQPVVSKVNPEAEKRVTKTRKTQSKNV